MTTALPNEVRTAAQEAVAPILLAGALDAPKVNPQTAKQVFEQLGIPTDRKVLVVVAYQGCGTHDFKNLEKAAKHNQAQLVVIYGQASDPTLRRAEQQGKLRQMVDDVDATVIYKNKQGNPLSSAEIRNFANGVGLTMNATGQITSVGSALYEANGAFKGVILDKQTAIASLSFLPANRGRIALG